MTDAPIVDTAAAPATPAPTIATDAPNGAVAPTVTNDFTIPDAYKDKPWASKIKSGDDLWTQLDNTQSLIGKKVVVPDWEKADPKEIDEYIGQLRPKDASAYKFAEDMAPEERTAYGAMLHDVGIPTPMANKLIEKYSEMEKATIAKAFSEEGLLAEKKASFGDNYEAMGAKVAKTISSNLSKEDLAIVDTKLPNNVVGIIYRLAANMEKAYGASESGAAAGNASAMSPVNVSEQANKIRNDIDALSRRQHTAEEKQTLVDQLNALYTRK